MLYVVTMTRIWSILRLLTRRSSFLTLPSRESGFASEALLRDYEWCALGLEHGTGPFG